MPVQTTIAKTATFASAITLSSFTLAAQASPVPWLGAAFAVLNVLKDMVVKAKANKNALHQVLDRSNAFLCVIQAHGASAPPEEQKELAQDAEQTIRAIVERMKPWCSMPGIKLFLKQDELADEILDCNTEIDDCVTRLQITAALETQAWQAALSSNLARDRLEMMEYLSNIKNTQDILLNSQQQTLAEIQKIMNMMQQSLPVTNSENQRGLEANLYHLQKSSHTMLVNMNLRRGEVKRVGQYPVGGTHTMDIWEGLYLNEEKVAIKIIRAVHASPRSLQRFTREVEIWRRVWEVDQGRHILPLYGFCQTDGPFPYVVTPWMPNGTVDKYVQNYPDVDHYALIKHICEGVNLLHSMVPPIVHGDIRGANIMIDGSGNPLLADFGFSRIVEDITGVAITQSSGIMDFQRWAARELCLGGKLTPKADVYSVGMTILELMSHQKPWPHIKFPHQVVLKVAEGDRPPRPTDDAVVKRGLDDRLWRLLERCWDEPANRPSMTELLSMLYYRATGWNEDNLYANLTRSSDAILDFSVPKGLYLSVSKAPNAHFNTSYTMNALPSLNGSLGYIFSSCELDIKNSGDVRLKDIVERFKVYDQPRRPEGREEETDYLLYSRLYLPSGRLDALYSTRLSSTVQALVAAISDPRSSLVAEGRARGDNVSNVMLSLQHDVGKWCTEYTWSAEDGMWGVRVLHNFGKLGSSTESSDESTGDPRPKRVDEEDATGGGLKGRVSAGAEIYASAKEKSAGVSLGVRFTTLPETGPTSQVSSRGPVQPPTTITGLFNPMMGHLSAAYVARVSRDLSLCSRFDFNVYSYDSEWTIGAEWWMRRSLPQSVSDAVDASSSSPKRNEQSSSPVSDMRGVVKARISTNNNVSLMWEGRLKRMLVSLGVVSDLSSGSKPIKAVGLELSYFSSDR
ncbi:hypothetical protein ID866_1235 [Astraeus odoratus]|nr:hypothetical protein ID866_1235 [Astraeus odoratus]